MDPFDYAITIGDRIKERREELGMTQSELAEEVGYKSRSSINKIENGTNDIPQSKVVMFADALNTSVAYLMGWEDDGELIASFSKNILEHFNGDIEKALAFNKTVEEEAMREMSQDTNFLIKRVPLVGTIACGIPILAEENIERQILLPDTVRADFALRCKGDSMINAGIDDGDIAFLRSQKIVENGEIAAVQISDFDTEATLKKVYITDSSITLVAQNPNFEPITFTGEEMKRVEIVGKCVAVLKDFDE